MIHVRDQDFKALTRDAFGEAFLTHTSTSPNQQLLASLDLARRQVDIEGFELVRHVYNMALVFRHRVRKDRLISKWFRILTSPTWFPMPFGPRRSARTVRSGRGLWPIGTKPGGPINSCSIRRGSPCLSGRPG